MWASIGPLRVSGRVPGAGRFARDAGALGRLRAAGCSKPYLARSMLRRCPHLVNLHCPPLPALSESIIERSTDQCAIGVREPPLCVRDCNGVSRQKVGRGRRQQFVQSCRTRSQSGQPRRRPGAGQRAGLRAPPLRSGRRRRSARLERPKIGPRGLIEAQHPVRAQEPRGLAGRAPTQRLLRGLAKTPHFTCVGPTY